MQLYVCSNKGTLQTKVCPWRFWRLGTECVALWSASRYHLRVTCMRRKLLSQERKNHQHASPCTKTTQPVAVCSFLCRSCCFIFMLFIHFFKSFLACPGRPPFAVDLVGSQCKAIPFKDPKSSHDQKSHGNYYCGELRRCSRVGRDHPASG
jgi:hypothetical protein